MSFACSFGVVACSGGGGGRAIPASISAAPPSAPTGAPQNSSAPAPAGTPVASNSTISDAAYASIANPGPWPSNFRPYCANASANPSSPCPWNDPLPDNPQQLYANSASIVSALFGGSGNGVYVPGDNSLANDFMHPVYLASASDQAVTVSCSANCGITQATFSIPSQARAADGADGHMAVIEPDGTEYDMYGAGAYAGQSSFTAGGLYKTSILGPGVMPSGGVTSGGALAAGTIRTEELNNGVIPHAIFAIVDCTSGTPVYPGTSAASTCSGGPPVGARLQLTLTDAQINALGVTTQVKAVLHALHDYGAYVLDTAGGPSGGGMKLAVESPTQYAAFGVSYPAPSLSGLSSAVPWASDLRIVSPCYAQETCTQ